MSHGAWIFVGLTCWIVGISGLIIMTGGRVVCP
jgi:hypothetical protein